MACRKSFGGFKMVVFVRLCWIICLCVMMCASMSMAFADDCENLNNHPEWNIKIQELLSVFKEEDWNRALKISRELEAICEFSPTLNYTIARIYKNKNDDEKYLFYLQKATQNTERFALDRDLLDRLWSEKYIVAHPEASPESIAEYKRQIESLKQAKTDKSEEIKVYKSVMWAGAGIGMGGLAMTAAGLGVALTSEPAEFYSGHGNTADKYKENFVHTLGWSLVGAGGAMTIIGAVLTGVYGYKYKHFFDNQNFTFMISPVHTELSMHF